MVIAAIIFCVSFFGLIPAVYEFATQLRASGFTTFFSLLFTDSKTVADAWQDFCYSLLESLPVGLLMSSVGLLMISLAAGRHLLKDLREVKQYRSTSLSI